MPVTRELAVTTFGGVCIRVVFIGVCMFVIFLGGKEWVVEVEGSIPGGGSLIQDASGQGEGGGGVKIFEF